VIFFFGWQNFAILQKLFFKKEYSDSNSFFEKKKSCQKKEFKKAPKFVTIAYNMKGYLKSFYFHILNIAKIG